MRKSVFIIVHDKNYLKSDFVLIAHEVLFIVDIVDIVENIYEHIPSFFMLWRCKKGFNAANDFFRTFALGT